MTVAFRKSSAEIDTIDGVETASKEGIGGSIDLYTGFSHYNQTLDEMHTLISPLSGERVLIALLLFAMKEPDSFLLSFAKDRPNYCEQIQG